MTAAWLRAGVAAAAMLLVAADRGAPRWDTPGDRNPILPGYFADPSIVHDGGRWYIFATIDPWGDDRLGLWTSANGRDWKFSTPAWPTKAAATSPTSGDSKVWAPSVVQAANKRWYMYVSVGSEVWVGTAPSPDGPWRDAHGGKPLIAKAFAPDYHMIDAEAFIDRDGQAYLYWGSGWNWINGHCFVVKLKPDMVTFDGTPRDVTPAHYFEAPFMVRAGRHYVLTYSDGKTTEDSYKVRYATGDSPFGPFREGANSPILATDAAKQVISPGHHAIFRSSGQAYILYHRQALPFHAAARDGAATGGGRSADDQRRRNDRDRQPLPWRLDCALCRAADIRVAMDRARQGQRSAARRGAGQRRQLCDALACPRDGTRSIGRRPRSPAESSAKRRAYGVSDADVSDRNRSIRRWSTLARRSSAGRRQRVADRAAAHGNRHAICG